LSGLPAGTVADRTFQALGLFLLAVPLLPLQALFGELNGARDLVPPPEWLVAIFVFGSLAWLVARFLTGAVRGVGSGLSLGGERLSNGSFSALGLLLLVGLLVITATFAFSGRPLLVDSVVQLFQARIFSTGRLSAPAPPEEAFFASQHMLVDGDKWYSQYPPGHSALLTLGVLAGRPWLVPVVLSTGTAALLSSFAHRAYDRATGRLTLVLLVLAPFFWFMGASFMNHVSCLFFVAAFLRSFVEWDKSGRDRWLGLAGISLGAAFLVRPLTAVAVGLVFGVVALITVVRRRSPRGLLAGAAGGAGPVGLYLAYNARTTGDPLMLGYLKLWGSSHGLGFHATPWGELHTVAAGLRNELLDLALLNGFLFEWPIPALIPVGLFCAAGWATRRWDRSLVLALVAIPAAYSFYWHRDAFLGPRFLYSSVAFAVPLTARAILEVYRRIGHRLVSERRSLIRVRVADLATALLVLCFCYSALYAAPRRFDVYRTGLASIKIDLPAQAFAAGIGQGLVFTPVSWGNRLLARARGLGVPATDVEKTYRRTDHCALELLLRRAELESWEPAAVTAALLALPSEGSQLGPRNHPNGDPTLRLAARAELPQACLDEILYDRDGYGNFLPHLVDNDPLLRGPLVIARDLRARNGELRAAYPGWKAYTYRAGRFVPIE
jgi:hypothetical protein